MPDFRNSQPLSLPSTVEFKEVERNTPTSQIQAVGAAIAICLGMYVVMFLALLGVALWIDWSPAWKPAMGLSGIFTAILAVYWAFSGTESIMWQVEKITGKDINKDHNIGQPLLSPPHVVVEAQAEDGRNAWTLSKLPGDPQVISRWIRAAIARQSLAIEIWEPQFGEMFTNGGQKVPIYTMFKQELRDRGYLIDRGSHGVILSNEGKRVLSGTLEQLLQLTSGEDE